MIKKRARIGVSVSFAVAMLAFGAPPGEAQNLVSALPVEPPSSLFSARLGDADVEAFAQGFWEASILSTGALSIGSADPGFNAVPFLFTQTPDLYTFLRYRQKWIFEAYVTQELKNARFSLAFEGDDADFVKSARLGNAGITMSAYPYMAFGSPEGSFGAAISASDAETGVSLEAMVRWDGLDWKTRTFFGGAEALETTLSPRDNLRGRRFVLGGTEVTGLVLVDTTASGSRTLNSDEYSASLATGVVLLKAEPRGTLTASWTDSGGSHVAQLLYSISVDTDGTVVRTSSIYEARNLYALPDTGSPRQLFVRSLATGTTAPAYTVSRVASGLIQVVKNEAAPSAIDDFMKPFFAGLPADAPWIYDESAASSPAGDGYAIVAKVVESVESITLEDATVAGTITVYRDGVESAAFDYDDDGRTLTLSPPPRSGERVQVRYAVSSQDRSNGALAFGVGSRFPWLGLDWATAVGGRWPLFGSKYDEAGVLKNAWLGLSAGVAKEMENALFALEGMVRYQRAGAAGLYRVAGMEDYSGSSNPLVPFRGFEGDFANVVATTETVPDLDSATAFAALIDDLHSTGSGNRALVLSAGLAVTGATFIRYVDYAPLPSFRTMSFFVKADTVPGGSTLTLSVGDGTGKGASVTVPLDLLGSGWRKIELDLDPMAGLGVYLPGGSTMSISGMSGSYTAPDNAGLVEIIVTGLDPGSVVMIDEILLEDPRDGFSALAGGSVFLGDKSKKEGAWFGVRADGALDAEPVIAGTAEAGWTGEGASLSASATPAWADGEGSLGVGYALAVPGHSSPIRYVDEFSRDEVLGRYGRRLEAAASAAGFSALAQAASAEEAATFSQSWKAMLSYGSLASITGTASLDAPAAPVAGLGIADSWLESWRLTMPAEESNADSRRLELSTALLGSNLTASASRLWDASSPAEMAFGAKAALPLRIGLVDLAPYYRRESAVDRQGSAASFSGDAAELAEAVSLAAGLWSAAPLAELWSADAFDGFGEFSAGATTASHRTELGMSVRRPIGYGLVDLFAPNAGTAAFARVLDLENDTLVESSVFSLMLSGGAANIFASNGVLPRLRLVVFDEYSYRMSLDLTRYASDGAVLPKLSSNYSLSMEGLSGSVIALSSSFSWEVTRTQTPWSESLTLAMNTRPARSWLGDIVEAAILSRRKASASRETTRTWVSEWFDTVTVDPPLLRKTFALDASVGRLGADTEPLVVRTSFDWASKAIAASALTVGVGAGLWQTFSISDGSSVWGFGYQLSIEARLVF